jgi:hypothetical protein
MWDSKYKELVWSFEFISQILFIVIVGVRNVFFPNTFIILLPHHIQTSVSSLRYLLEKRLFL